MKKIIVLLIFSVCTSGLLAHSSAWNAHVDRQVYQSVQESSAKVSVLFSWEKITRMHDVMSRPVRGKDIVLRQEQENTSCSGVVSTENRIYFLADCLEPGSFEEENLKSFQITFANGITVTGDKTCIGRYNDIAWIRVQSSALEGLHLVPVNHTPRGQSLQEAYGNSMTQKLVDFFQNHGVHARTRTCRIGPHYTHVTLKEGDPVMIDGKLMALVKRVPRSYGGFWGGVSENSLAVIY